MKTNAYAALAAVLLLALGGFSSKADAGQLLLRNTSSGSITCAINGQADWSVTIAPAQAQAVPPNHGGQAVTINSATCGNLATRMMNITPDGPNGMLVLNGRQNRTLNVSLYAFIPNPPGATFETLINHVIETYQRQNPDVLLSAQMNPGGPNSYKFDILKTQLERGGFDVMEIDTLLLGYVAGERLVNAARITGDAPYPVALRASTVRGQLWGIPSWLCMDFIFARDPAIRNVRTLPQLLGFLARMPRAQPQMVGNYNGSWRLPSMYINAYVQTYGYGRIAQSMVMPPDPAAIRNMISVTATCSANNANLCTHDSYGDPGSPEQAFVNLPAGANMDFSESSFFINFYRPTPRLHVIPVVWGNRPQPLLFSDTFVTSSANCPAQSQCATDATAFTTMMTGAAMKTYIVQSRDLPAASPWRTLLVATQSFYRQPFIANHPLYRQYMPVLRVGQAFPNEFTSTLKDEMRTQICQALQAQTSYDC